jgi:hypothetical protein
MQAELERTFIDWLFDPHCIYLDGHCNCKEPKKDCKYLKTRKKELKLVEESS